MKFCPKSIKTTLKMTLSYAMLSGTSWATLHRVLTCSMLTQEYSENIALELFSAILSRASRATLHRDLTCTFLSKEF